MLHIRYILIYDDLSVVRIGNTHSLVSLNRKSVNLIQVTNQ